MEDIQRPPVIFHFGRSQVKGQHYLVFRHGQVQRLFDGLRLDAVAPEQADHLVGIPGIAAEPVPFREQQQIRQGTGSCLFIPPYQRHPFRPVKGLCRMVLIDHFAHQDIVDAAISVQRLVLTPLGIALVGLLIGAYPYVQISYRHWISVWVGRISRAVLLPFPPGGTTGHEFQSLLPAKPRCRSF